MKKWWIAVLLAMAMMATACGSGSSSDNAGKQVSESKDDEQDTIEYEEFEKLAMTFELPVGTTEEEGQAGTRCFYRNEDLYVMLERELKFQLDDATFAEYLANIAEGFEGKTSKTKKMKIDGFQGYQADIDGKVNDEPMVMTLVSFNVPIGFISFLMTDQDPWHPCQCSYDAGRLPHGGRNASAGPGIGAFHYGQRFRRYLQYRLPDYLRATSG